MNPRELDIVTGAFGLTGRWIAELLLASEVRVRTLTNHPPRAADPEIEIAPLDFSDSDRLAASLAGARVLYNTYWVRFPHDGLDHAAAVRNTRTLLQAARKAGVQRFVHVSITNPSLDSPLSYFRGKAEVEAAIRESGISYAILRPALLFGPGDILINNIAWLLRKFPLFAIPGDGEYALQPTFVGDLAALAVGMGSRADDVTVDAVGPETYTYTELVTLVRRSIRSSSHIVHVSPRAVLAASSMLGLFLRDEVLTGEEIKGLMSGLLVSAHRPLGRTSLKQWLAANRRSVGMTYASELHRHYKVGDGAQISPVAPRAAISSASMLL